MDNKRLYPILLSSDDDDEPGKGIFPSSPHHVRFKENEEVNNFHENNIYERQKAQLKELKRHSLSKSTKKPNKWKGLKKLSFLHRMLIAGTIGVSLGVVISLVIVVTREKQLIGNFLDCEERGRDGLHIDEYCVLKSHMPQISPVILNIMDNLTVSQGLVECGSSVSWPTNVTFKELKKKIEQQEPVKEGDTVSLTESVLHLILKNPQWQLSLVDENGNTTTQWTDQNISNVIIRPRSATKGILCATFMMGRWLWSWTKWILAGGVLVLMAYCVLQWYVKKREREVQSMFIMVDRILEVLRRHYDEAKRDDNLLPYLAIVHVRDMLIPPPERKRKQSTWDRAVEWLATHESRVRVETRKIAGEEFTVWRWIQIGPPSTDNPAFLEREKYWQGRATEHYPPALDAKIAPPTGQPSKCIRLKNMFEGIRKLNQEQVQEIESSVLDKCIPNGGVVHIKVDRRSPYGCVYLKMDSIQSASKTYKALHGGWFRGKLITAKFIPESKYHKWFPDAVSAKKFLYPPD